MKKRTDELICPICNRKFIMKRQYPQGAVYGKKCLAELRRKHGIDKQPNLF